MDKKNSYECLLCNKDLTKELGFGEEVSYPIYHEQLNKNESLVAFLICSDCITHGIFPDEEDIKYIREGWNKGGFLLGNYKKSNSEVILLCLLADRIADGKVKVELNDQKGTCLTCKWEEKPLTINLNELKSRQEKKEKEQ